MFLFYFLNLEFSDFKSTLGQSESWGCRGNWKFGRNYDLAQIWWNQIQKLPVNELVSNAKLLILIVDQNLQNGTQKIMAGDGDFMTRDSIIQFKTKNCEGYDRIPQRILLDVVDALDWLKNSPDSFKIKCKKLISQM